MKKKFLLSGRKADQARKRGISEIVATLLMLVIAVGIGVTVLGFATNGFDTYGNSFQNLFSSSSNQITENVVIEEAILTSTGVASTSGVTLYILNAGTSASTISALYVQNLTVNSFVGSFTSSPLPVTISAGTIQSVKILGFIPDHGCTYGLTLATSLGNTVIYDAKYN